MGSRSLARTAAPSRRHLGDGGIALPLPERLTPVSLILPTAEEVEPWVETIIRLWDDASVV